MKEAAIACSLVLAAACGGDPPPSALQPDAGRQPLELRIEPAESTLVFRPGAAPAEIALSATDAATGAPLAASFRLIDGTGVGRVSREGRFVAEGARAGSAEIEARVSIEGRAASARARVTVRIEDVDANAVTSAERARIDGAELVSGGRDPLSIVYPLEGSIMPANVAPPLIQWWGTEWGSSRPSGRGDILRVELIKSNVTIVKYFVDNDAHTHSWRVPQASWQRLVRSDPGAEIRVLLHRHRESEPSTTVTESRFRVVESETRAAIYYWDLTLGRIVRVQDGGGGRAEDFAPNVGCLGCHTISPSGRYLAAASGSGHDVRIFDTTNPELGSTDRSPPVLSDPPAWPERRSAQGFAWFPDEEHVVMWASGAFSVHQRSTGNAIAFDPSGVRPGGDRAFVHHPDISHDGRSLAFVHAQSSWEYNFGPSAIVVQDVNGTRFGEPRLLVDGAAPHESGIDACAEPFTVGYPNFSPDDMYVVYSRGCGNATWSAADAFVVRADGTGGAPVRLARAVADANASHVTFSPDADRRYAWVAFIANRRYGNPLAGYGSAPLRHIWAAAIDLEALAAGEDPSGAAYRVEGPAYRAMGTPFSDRPSIEPYDATVLELDYARVCACTIDGACHATGDRNPTNPCEVCFPAWRDGWSQAEEGATCDDGSTCTTTDACNATGTCEGHVIECDDGLSCTTDSCAPGTGACAHEVTSGCLIDGACHEEGTRRARGSCDACIPDSSIDAWSVSPGCGGLSGGGAG